MVPALECEICIWRSVLGGAVLRGVVVRGVSADVRSWIIEINIMQSADFRAFLAYRGHYLRESARVEKGKKLRRRTIAKRILGETQYTLHVR